MKATFAAGCFWHVEDIFNKMTGVTSTRVGYTGGTKPNPTYEDVCGDGTGHAEAVQVEYDPDHISYDTLLNVFWKNHNPTTPNRQGYDIGTQYRSVIFCHDPSQLEAAKASRSRLDNSGTYDRPIVTQVVDAMPFYDAEEYHQKYFEKMRRAGRL